MNLTQFLLRRLQVGGTEEYKICEAVKKGTVTKPVVVWCIGTCAAMFTSEVSRLGTSPYSGDLSPGFSRPIFC